MKTLLYIIISATLVVSGYSQTRNVIVGTNDVIVQPTNFWSANASNGRTGLGLGSAATNLASAFQSSSLVLSNLSSSNGINITNLQSSNIVGAISISNVTGTLTIASGGTGATNAATARTNLGFSGTGQDSFIGGGLFNEASGQGSSVLGGNYNIASGIGSAVVGGVNNTSTNYSLSGGRQALATNVGSFVWADSSGNPIVSFSSTNDHSFNVRSIGGMKLDLGTNGIAFRGAFAAESASATRTNLGLGATWLTNTNITNFRTSIQAAASTIQTGVANEAMFLVDDDGATQRLSYDAMSGDAWQVSDPSEFRLAIELSLPALTNTNNANFLAAFFGSNTNPVLVNTNGAVVSPTNFWQVAPIQTVVQNLAPITNSTNAATNARNLYVYSLATNITGVTNTVTLPTNTSTFAGDSATIIHQGPTSSVTAVRQAGAGSNLITINRFDESVKFIYENNGWTTYHNISFQEPIYFSGTSATANAATSRNNLGLGVSNNVHFAQVIVTKNDLGTGFYSEGGLVFESDGTNIPSNVILFSGDQSELLRSRARTNLGLGFSALTNTNAAGFQRAIFTTNAAPTNSANINTVNFNTAVAWIEISVVTNSVTNSYRIPVFQ